MVIIKSINKKLYFGFYKLFRKWHRRSTPRTTAASSIPRTEPVVSTLATSRPLRTCPTSSVPHLLVRTPGQVNPIRRQGS